MTKSNRVPAMLSIAQFAEQLTAPTIQRLLTTVADIQRRAAISALVG